MFGNWETQSAKEKRKEMKRITDVRAGKSFKKRVKERKKNSDPFIKTKQTFGK